MAKSSTGVKIAEGVAATLAVAGVAAAGYYFYASPKGKQHRKSAVKWAEQMRRQVIKQSSRLQAVSPEAVATIVDSVTKIYRDAKSVDPKELKKAANELKKNWKKIKEEARKPAKRRAKTVKESP